MAGKKKRVRRPRRIEMQFLEAVRVRCPHDTLVLKALGDLYTEVGRCEEGLAIDLDLAGRCPRDPDVWYNLACSFARTGDADRALDALAKAIDYGYRDSDWLQRDEDLKPLYDDYRFRRLLQKILPD